MRSAARAVSQTQNNNQASTLVIPSDSINPPPPRTELIIRANDLQQQAKQLDGLVSDQGVSALQRTVLMSRATDLKRQVKALDDIVTSQFQQEDQTADRALNRQSPIEPAALFTSSLFRSSPTQQQPTAGALRAAAKNSASLTTLSSLFNPPTQPPSSLVDLIA